MCMLSNNYWPFLVSIHSGVLFYYPTSSFVYYLHCSSHVNTVLTDHSTNERYLIPVRAIPIFLVFSASASKTYKMTTSRKTTYRCGTGTGALSTHPLESMIMCSVILYGIWYVSKIWCASETTSVTVLQLRKTQTLLRKIHRLSCTAFQKLVGVQNCILRRETFCFFGRSFLIPKWSLPVCGTATTSFLCWRKLLCAFSGSRILHEWITNRPQCVIMQSHWEYQ